MLILGQRPRFQGFDMPPDSLWEQCKTWQRKELTYTVSVGSLPLMRKKLLQLLRRQKPFRTHPACCRVPCPYSQGFTLCKTGAWRSGVAGLDVAGSRCGRHFERDRHFLRSE